RVARRAATPDESAVIRDLCQPPRRVVWIPGVLRGVVGVRFLLAGVLPAGNASRIALHLFQPSVGIIGIHDRLAFRISFILHFVVAVVGVGDRAVLRIGRTGQQFSVVDEGAGLGAGRPRHRDYGEVVQQ